MIQTIIFVMVFSFSAVTMAKTSNPAVLIKKDGRIIRIANLRPGEPSHKAFNQALQAKFAASKGKTLVCKGLTDGTKCKGKTGWANRRCQASLAIARCRAAGDALSSLNITVLYGGGGEYKAISGKYRGVMLSFFGKKIPYCTEDDLGDSKNLFLSVSRNELIKDKVTVVPKNRSLNQARRTKKVLLEYDIHLNRDNELVVPAEKICWALISKGAVKPKTQKVVQVIKTEVTHIHKYPEGKPGKPGKAAIVPCPACPEGYKRPAHKAGVCPVCVKKKPEIVGILPCPACPKGQIRPKSDDPRVCLACKDKEVISPVKETEGGKSSMPLFLRRAMVFGGFYFAKECNSLSNSEASNGAVEGIFPIVEEKNYAVRVALGFRSHSWSYVDDMRIMTKRHDIFLHLGVEGMWRFNGGELGLRAGIMGDLNFGTYRPQAEVIGRIFVYKDKLAIDVRAGIGLFRYSTEVDLENKSTKPYGYGLIGLTWQF